MDFKYAQSWLLGVVCFIYGIYRVIGGTNETFNCTLKMGRRNASTRTHHNASQPKEIQRQPRAGASF